MYRRDPYLRSANSKDDGLKWLDVQLRHMAIAQRAVVQLVPSAEAVLADMEATGALAGDIAPTHHRLLPRLAKRHLGEVGPTG